MRVIGVVWLARSLDHWSDILLPADSIFDTASSEEIPALIVLFAITDMMAGVGIGIDALQRATPIVSGFLLGYIEIGEREGARVELGGTRVREETGGYYIPPTILAGVDNRMRVAREEIFGPVITVTEFTDEAEAIAIANDTPYGLAAAVWTRDVVKAHRISRRLRAGTVWVNTFDAADHTVPFGGFKQSGFGRDKSLHALEGFTQLKTTWLDLSGR